jgi:hypothetical protein
MATNNLLNRIPELTEQDTDELSTAMEEEIDPATEAKAQAITEVDILDNVSQAAAMGDPAPALQAQQLAQSSGETAQNYVRAMEEEGPKTEEEVSVLEREIKEAGRMRRYNTIFGAIASALSGASQMQSGVADPNSVNIINNAVAAGNQLAQDKVKDAIALDKINKEKELNDPKSEVSRQERQFIKDIFKMNISDNISAAQLRKRFGSLANIETARMAQKQRSKEFDRKMKLAEKKQKDTGIGELTIAERKTDEIFSKENDRLTSTGLNNAASTIQTLEIYLDELIAEAKKPEYRQRGGGAFTSMLPDFMRTRKGIEFRDQIALAANATLKELFPGQISDDERKAAAREYYNDALPITQNMKILRRKIDQLKRGFKSQVEKVDHFSDKRTLKGWKPSYDFRELIPQRKKQDNEDQSSRTYSDPEKEKRYQEYLRKRRQ